MKKKLIALTLVFVLMFISATPAYAKTTYTHYNLALKNYPDEHLDFLVPSNNAMVYVRADEIVEIINVNGYDFFFSQDNAQCAIISQEYKFILVFTYGSKKIDLFLSNFHFEYKTPGEALVYMGYAYIPFEFMVNLFDITCLILEDGISMEAPTLTALMTLSYLRNSNELSFDWVDEIGYSQKDFALMSGSAATVNLFSDLLSNECLTRWGDIFGVIFTGENYFNDRKVATDISALFTNPSFEETASANENLAYKGAELTSSLWEIIGEIVEMTGLADKELFGVSDLKDAFETMFKSWPELKGNSQLSSIYKSLVNGADTFGDITFKMDMVSDYLKFFCYGFEMFFYIIGFENKSDTAAKALSTYATILDKNVSSAMTNYADTVISSDAADIMYKYFNENLHKILIDSIPLGTLLGAPAAILLAGWDIASKTFPCIKDTLESTDNFEISEHAIAHQTNAFNLFKNEWNDLRNEYSDGNLSRSSIENLRALAYSYLKFSVIARNSATAVIDLASGISYGVKEIIIESLNETNEIIGSFLLALESPTALYLPEDSSSNRNDWNTSAIISVLDRYGLEIVNLDEMTTESPYYNNSDIGDYIDQDSYEITEEEAVYMIKEVMGQAYFEIFFKGAFDELYTFEVIDTVVISDLSLDAYVIALIYGGEEYEYLFFVPTDGSAVWIGWREEDGGYFCFTDIDMYNMSMDEIIASMTDLFFIAGMESLYESDLF